MWEKTFLTTKKKDNNIIVIITINIIIINIIIIFNIIINIVTIIFIIIIIIIIMVVSLKNAKKWQVFFSLKILLFPFFSTWQLVLPSFVFNVIILRFSHQTFLCEK